MSEGSQTSFTQRNAIQRRIHLPLYLGKDMLPNDEIIVLRKLGQGEHRPLANVRTENKNSFE